MGILDFTAYIRQRMSELTSNTIKQGSAVDELAVKSSAALAIDINDRMSSVVIANDPSQSATWTDDQVKAYASRWELPWMTGTKASGYVRVWVPVPGSVSVFSNQVLITSKQGLTFRPTEDSNVSGLEFTADSVKGLYWIDIPVTATGYGANFNIQSGSVSRIDGFSLSVSEIDNPSDFQNGTDGETREEYLIRSQYGRGDRSLLSYRGVKSTMKKFFPFVRSVYVAGSGDEYMERDVVDVKAITTSTTSFLGKTSGVVTVPHSAYRDVFPPEADSQTLNSYGTTPPKTGYDFPASVVSVDYLSKDPGLRGFRLSREFSSEDYSGLYFDDGMTGSSLVTTNMIDMNTETDFAPNNPNQSWRIGSHGSEYAAFEFGNYSVEGSTIFQSEIVNLLGGTLSMKTGDSGLYAYASKECYRNAGMIIRGVLAVSDSIGSDMMCLIGGANDSNAYSGLGFGITKIDADDTNPERYVVYITHNNGVASHQMFIKPDDLASGSGLGMISALAEAYVPTSVISSSIPTWFEMVVTADYQISLKLYNNTTGEQSVSLSVGGPISAQIKNTISTDPQGFGTRVKFCACNSQATSSDPVVSWQDVIVRDLTPRRATALMLFDISGMQAPINITAKARGSASSQGQSSYGLSTYIWDNEIPAMAGGVIPGGWSMIDSMSDTGAQQTMFSSGGTVTLTEIDRYRCDQLNSNVLAILMTTTGVSFTGTEYGDQDIESEVGVDFVSITPVSEIKARLGNCVDIYVNSYNNSGTRPTTQLKVYATNGIIDINPPDPVMSIVSITDSIGSDVTVDATLVRYPTATQPYRVRVYVSGANGDYNMVYTPYYGIAAIQKYYDSKQYGSVTGGVSVVHKNPVDVEISWTFSGAGDATSVERAIRSYIDSRPDTMLDLNLCFQSLNQQGLCSSLGSDSRITYTDPVSHILIESQRASIRAIDFFRITSVQVNKA